MGNLLCKCVCVCLNKYLNSQTYFILSYYLVGLNWVLNVFVLLCFSVLETMNTACRVSLMLDRWCLPQYLLMLCSISHEIQHLGVVIVYRSSVITVMWMRRKASHRHRHTHRHPDTHIQTHTHTYRHTHVHHGFIRDGSLDLHSLLQSPAKSDVLHFYPEPILPCQMNKGMCLKSREEGSTSARVQNDFSSSAEGVPGPWN